MQHILLVEDDLSLAVLIKTALQTLPIRVVFARSIAEAHQRLSERVFELVLLDRLLPDGSGIELAQYLHREAYFVKILMISQLKTLEDRMGGWETGVDDYLPKPFSMTELRFKVKRWLSTRKIPLKPELKLGEGRLELTQGQFVLPDKKIKLRPKEMALLECLIHYQDQVVSREHLIQSVWAGTTQPSYATIEVYIRRLRMGLAEYGKLIETVRGFGYRLKATR